MSAPCEEQAVPPQTGDGEQAESPLELSPPDWRESLRRAVKEFKDDRASTISAGMAFYWFLAVFPSLLALVGLMGLFNAGQAATETISGGVRAALPGDAAKVLTDALAKAGAQSDGAAVVATLVGLGLALWSASAGMVAMQVGLDVAYDVEQDRKFVKKRAVALLLLVVTAVLGGAATVLVVFGQPVGDAIRDNLPLGGAFVAVWTVARWVLALGALMVLFAAFYYVAPNRESPRWAWVSPGGALAALIWLAASLGFSFYVSSFGSYAETYGSLAGVVVLMLWLYLSALAVMIGGELNAELERQSALNAGQMGGGGGDRSRPPGGRDVGASAGNGSSSATTGGQGPADGSPERARAWAKRMRELHDDGGHRADSGRQTLR